MGEQIRVLMLVGNLRVSNGVANYAMNYFRKINHAHVKMDFCLLDDIPTTYYEEVKRAGGQCFFLPPIKNFFQHVIQCKKILKEGHYDIIHDNCMLPTYFMMKIAQKYVPIRILHSHSSKLGSTFIKEKRNKLFSNLLVTLATNYAACSSQAAKALFANKEYELIPNIVATEKYRYNPQIRSDIRIEMHSEDKVIMVTVGRLAIEKNPFFALDVFDILAENISNIEYWWIGNGQLDVDVQQYTKKLKHKSKIRLLGSRNDVVNLYQAADLFFLPSLFEGVPITVLEAQAMGLPCILSDSITKDVVFTDLVRFVSLKENKEH